MSSWDEIKRLAADFQKVQLTSTLQRLSENNCIEIVSLLLEKNYVKAIFTNDGKEYITPEHLEREVLDELACNGGRINLVEVSKTLNVDHAQVEEIAIGIAASRNDVYFMLGQLINEDYLQHIAEEVNEKLLQHGEVSLSDLTQNLELPADFLQKHLTDKYLGKIIHGRQDPTNPRVFFTQAYLQRCKAKLRGTMAAITRPVNVSSITNQINMQEKLFHTLLDEISRYGFVTSKLSNATYIPHVFSEMQINWTTLFFKQNGFIQYDHINKLGITDAKQFIRKILPNDEMLFLERYALGTQIIDLTLLSAITECQAAKSYVDLSTILPSTLEEDDIEELFNLLQKKQKVPNNIVFLNNVVFSEHFMENLLQPCYDMARNLAKNSVESGSYQKYLAEKQLVEKVSTAGGAHDDDVGSKKSDKRDERRKKALGGKLGGGSQGRETKTKSTKKHTRNARRGDSSDDELDERNNPTQNLKKLQLITLKDVLPILNKQLEDEGLNDISEAIAKIFIDKLNQFALKCAEELYQAVPQSGARRNNHAATQEKVNNLLVDIRLYDKGLKLFPEDVQAQLTKYLLKSLGYEICTSLTLYLANECNLLVKNSENLNADQCLKIVQECDEEYRAPFTDLIKSCNRTIDDFLTHIEIVLKSLSMIVKKIDKKKDRQLIIQHKENLLQQLQQTNDPPLVLHLTVLILFTTISGCILHASGKFIVNIIKFLKPSLNSQENALLQQYHDLVCTLLQSGEDKDTTAINETLSSLQEQIKNLAEVYQKSNSQKQN